jgi:Zn-finger nucleic acid-binding protein
MDCPRCSVELSEISRDESTLQRCGECGGLWVDVADLNKILLHSNLPALSAIGGFVNADEISGMCPACNVDLVVVEGGEKRSVSYDTCESCGGIWIDSDADEPAPELDWKGATGEIVAFFRRFARKPKK